MSLDQSTAALLEGMKEQELPPFTSEAVGDWREAIKTVYVSLGRDATAVDKSERRDIAGVPCEVIWPKGASGSLPVAIYFHGGGWVTGDAEAVSTMCQWYANRLGAVVVNVDYRLGPEHPFPAAADDCLAVTEWLSKNAASLGGDANRMAVFGDSAGGNLSAVVAQALRDKGIALAAQGLIYPAVDLRAESNETYPSRIENGDGYFLTKELMDWFIAHYVTEAGMGDDIKASPALGNLTGVAPAMVITAGFDPLRDEGRAYADALKTAGVPVDFVEYGDTIHGFFVMAKAIPASLDAQEKLAGWMEKQLKAGAAQQAKAS
jgi:acetyl esterase